MKKRYFISMLNIAAIILAWLFGWCSAVSSSGIITKSDTITIVRHDTIRITETKLVSEKVIRHDTILVSVPAVTPDGSDTVYILPAEIERVQRMFEGDHYRAWISGCCEPWIDKIDIDQDVIETTITVHEKEKPKRWGLGIQAGTTYDFAGKKIDPYIGIGISYNIVRW